MDLLYIYKILLRKKWWLIVIPCLAGIVAYFLGIRTEKLFKSSALISTGFTVNDQFRLNNEDKVSAFDASNKFNNLIETMNSRLVVTFLSYNLILHDLNDSKPFRSRNPLTFANVSKEQANEVFKEKLEKFGLLSPFNEEENKILQILGAYNYDFYSLKDKLSVKRVNSSDYISIEFKSENPALSEFVVNTIAQEFIRYNYFLNSNKSIKALDFYSNLVDQAKKSLDEKSEAVNTYKLAHGLYNLETENETKLAQLSQLEARKMEEEKKIQGLRLSLNDINQKLYASGGPSAESNNVKIVDLRNKINTLNDKYINSGSKDKSLLESISHYRDILQFELSKLSDNTNSSGSLKDDLAVKKDQYQLELSIANANLSTINNSILNLKNNVSAYATIGDSLGKLMTDEKVASEQYLMAMEKFNNAKKASLASENNVRIALYGQAAVEPEPSKTGIFSGLATAASFALCVLVIVLVELVDQTTKTPSNLKNITNLPSLGFVNLLKNKNSKNIPVQNLFLDSNNYPEVDSFKQLLRNLRFEIESSGAKTVLVTSPKPGEGKTFLIIALASAFSLKNKKVLIIDTNFKKNDLSKTLIQDGQKAGFTAQLSDQLYTNFNETANNITSPTTIKNVSIISNEGSILSPSEIISLEQLNTLTEHFARQFDVILLEGAALNLYPDTRELSLISDKVISIFSANESIKPSDQSSIDFLTAMKGRHLGTVLNKVKMENIDL